jgi:hypothetical protein
MGDTTKKKISQTSPPASRSVICHLRPAFPTVIPRDPSTQLLASASCEIWRKTIIHNSATTKMLQSQIVKLVAEEARINWISLIKSRDRVHAHRGTVLYLGCHVVGSETHYNNCYIRTSCIEHANS